MEPHLHQQFQDMIYDIIHILFSILFIYLAIDIFYLLAVCMAGLILEKKSYTTHPVKKKIAVLITSFKEDEVILQTAASAAGHNYPAKDFDVYLAADQLQPDTIVQLRKLNITVYEVKFDTGSKARSLNYLLNSIDRQYDIALILDGDNIMLPGFLEKINAAFQQGFRAAQGHRTAKNKNSPVAVLDAVSEEINNHLFRRSQRALHLSAAIIGSGMAFEFDRLQQVYNKPGILDNPACDREVDFEMMKAGVVVEYLDNALLLDEKVSQKKIFQNQRRRWLESQVIHLKLFFSRKEKIANKTKNYWNKLFINLLPPRTIFLFVFFVLFIVFVIQKLSGTDITGISFTWWLLLFIGYMLCMILSVPGSFYNRASLKALVHLPLLMVSFLKAALTMKAGRKEFVHTPKTYTGND